MQIVSSAQTISLLVGISVFFFVVLFAVIKDEIENNASRIKRPENEWLFTRWDEKLYDVFTKDPPEKTLKSFGVDVEDYKKNCIVAKIKNPNLKKLAARKMIGLLLLFFGVLLLIISMGGGILLPALIMLIGVVLYQGDVSSVKKQALSCRKRLERELPRFLDLLQTALYIDIPVSDAILITAKRLNNTLISRELVSSIAETQMGSVSWQTALQELALVYDVDMLSDFVQYLINGYEKGLNIYDVVERQATETRKVALISAEENANKLNTSILIPIAVFKLFPLIAIVAFPLIKQLTGSMSIF